MNQNGAFTLFKIFFCIISCFIFCGMRSQNIISTVAGNGTLGFTGNGSAATSAEIFGPYGVAVAANGDLYFSDSYNNQIRKVDQFGTITAFAGTSTAGYSGDGGAATTAKLSLPFRIEFDLKGNLFFADHNNHVIRKITPAGIISTVAGNGTQGYSGDGGLATSAHLSNPEDVAIDSLGTLFIADVGNNRIRKVDTNGIISTYAGNGFNGFSGDGGAATSAELKGAVGIGLDKAGSLYIAESGDSRIRKVDANGIINTIIGNGTGGFSGDGGQSSNAQVNAPQDVIFDALDNMYIADQTNNRIRKVDISGIITTIAGNGSPGYNGDGIPALNAELNTPESLAFDALGNIYIPDFNNARIRMVTNVAEISEIIEKNELLIYPNPSNNYILISSKVRSPQAINILDINGRIVLSHHSRSETKIDVSNLDNGVYTLYIKDDTEVSIQKLIISRY